MKRMKAVKAWAVVERKTGAICDGWYLQRSHRMYLMKRSERWAHVRITEIRKGGKRK